MLGPEVSCRFEIKVAETWAERTYPALRVFSTGNLMEVQIRDDVRIFVTADCTSGCLVELYRYQSNGKGRPLTAIGEPVARSAGDYPAMAAAIKELMGLA